MVTRNVVLTPDQSAFVDDLVATGRFQNASEALRAGLRMLQDAESAQKALVRRLERGLSEAKDGDLVEGDGESVMRGVFDRIRSRLE